MGGGAVGGGGVGGLAAAIKRRIMSRGYVTDNAAVVCVVAWMQWKDGGIWMFQHHGERRGGEWAPALKCFHEGRDTKSNSADFPK